tara:strand:+ start:136 stop:489 length:354 start_codon:yes stop_codon:yes gene_type:complete
MFISSSGYSLTLTIESYKEMKETARENGNMKVFLRGQIEGIYQGLLGMVIIIESNAKKHGTKTNVALWCSPDNLSLNYQNLIFIVDKELERRKLFYRVSTPISFVLYAGLLNRFPCK